MQRCIALPGDNLSAFLNTLRYAYLRHVVAPALRLCGPRAACALANRLADGVFHLKTPGRVAAEARLKSVYRDAPSAASIAGMAAAHYRHLARFWMEAAFIPGRMDRDWRRWCSVPEADRWHLLGDRTTPLVVATACHGNVAVAACALAHMIGPVHVLYERAVHRGLAAWQDRLFRRPGLVPVHHIDAGSMLPRVMEEKGVILIIGEHHRARGAAVPAVFLGRHIRAYPTIGRLAAWYDANVAIMTCIRGSEPFRFRLHCHDVLDASVGNGDAANITRECLRALERAVLEAPEQYLWSMPNWLENSAGATRMRAPRTDVEAAALRETTVRAAGQDWSASPA